MDFFAAAKQLRTNKSILFVTSQLRQREIKMAHALKSLGWVVGLLYYNSTPFKPDGHFDFFLEVKSAKKAHKYAKMLAPRLVHVFSGAIDDYVLLFCHDKVAPVVIDLNDVFSPSLMDYCPERYSTTKEALALADGFCARDLQVKCAERLDHLKIPPQIIFFPEYCWNDRPVLTPKTSSDEIHIVSVGTISLETYGMYDCCYLELVKLILNQHIHFHIYPPWSYRKDHHLDPNVNFERDYAQFLELERNNPYLHIHDSLPAEQLIHELPQYDFGIISGGYEGFGQRYSHFKPEYVKSCYSGRIADYLDAHLPVLINEEVVFDYWLLKRYGVAIDLKGVEKSGFKAELQNVLKTTPIKTKVAAAKSTLSILNNAHRLANFYLETMQTRQISADHSSILKRLTRMIPRSLARIGNWGF
ncbi:hypothetical protein AQULUS_05610 [Aquicella lusitana]|uniref:Glycosyl transferase family 1 n=2 Tax=Aquicella lusitana TaxID=254246 RepID=A0A370GWV5_9COXI|nr:hypothetical protein [Aquicella lusitana]RDI48147.1 hypothetical protein C8D86_103112 [Aquicella lusitana]VVC72837.1 hypothetical protein AQULUS_05610 [Aquicella lusitana]